MPAVSKKQQRFFGMVRAAQKGEMENPSPEISKVAASTSMSSVKKFAKTKHKGLPEKKVASEGVVDAIKKIKLNKTKVKKSPYSGRDAGAIAAKVMRQKQHNKYVNFLPMDEEKKGDHEPEMIRNQLKTAKRASKRIKSHTLKKDNFKAWVQSKITKASDYLDTAADYLDSKDVKEDKQVKKIIKQLRKSVKAHDKQADTLEKKLKEESNPRIPRKKGQPANSKKHSDLYTDENPKGTIHGLGFKDVDSAKASVSKIRNSSRSHAHKIQAAVAMEQRAREMGKTSEAAVYRKYINSMKKKTKKMNEAANPAQQAAIAINMKKKGKKPKDMNEGSLHKWFKGSKSKDGKGGWVNVVTGGTCASDEPGEGTPKCVSSSKRASMTKAERLSAARRKKKADPGQQSKTGAAKPTYVSTDSPRKKKMKESYGGKGVSRKAKLMSTHPPTAQAAIKNIPTETDRGSGNKAKRRAGLPVEKKSPTYKAYVMNKEENVVEAKDKKGKGSGTKDACYHKVKSRYSVWPSAYASGALVKCRKVGAANWGNSSKKEEFEPTGISFQQFQEKCWKGYEKKGMKTMFGKRYPNCVKKEEVEVLDERQKDSDNQRLSQERGRSNYGKASIRNVRATGKGGNAADPAERLVAIDARHKAHKEKRGVKTKGMSEAKVDDRKVFGVTADRNERRFGKKGAFDPAGSGPRGQDPSERAKLAVKRGQEHRARRGVKTKGVKEEIMPEAAAWTKKSGKNPSGGLNEKGRKSYERENPGSDLKRPSKKVGNKRRASFCARMKGMKKKLTSSKTANDPDSRINKSLRAWNC